MSTTVHVKNISNQTSEKEVRDFFSFCGKISSLSVTPESDAADASKSATVTFEKETAAKTALLLDNTQLGPAQVHVTSAKSMDELAGGKTEDDGEVPQEEKPKARIVAEMMAHGYHFSNTAIEKALALDQQHGFSSRFTQYLQGFDSKYKASDKAKAMDAKYGVSDRASQGWLGLSSYFDKAASTPTGQKLREFYMQGQKQVMDVHNEALHLQKLKYGSQGPYEAGTAGAAGATNTPRPLEGNPERTECSCSADTGKCPCAPGTCACSGCAKNPDHSTGADPEKMEMEKVGEDGKTKCNCGGEAGTCPCAPGQCTCNSCAKNPEKA